MSANQQIILGIDPGTRSTGYGILKVNDNNHMALDFGCIRPPQKLHLTKKYFIIFEAVENLIKKYKPDTMVVETQFMKKNFQSAMKIGMARCCAILAAEKNNIELYEYAPRQAKLAIVGNGSASKEQVQKMLKMLLNLNKEPSPEDAADALALAVCHAHKTILKIKGKLNV